MRFTPDRLAWPAFFFTLAWLISANAYSYFLLVQGCDIRVVENIDTVLLSLIATLLFFQKQAGFPSPLDKKISNKDRLAKPALVGIFFGLLDILVIRGIMHPEAYNSLPPFLQPFPYSIFLYMNGAIYMEIFYRLLPFMLIMLPVTWFTPDKYHLPVFMAVAIVSSMAEPLMQFPQGPLWFRIYATVSGFAMNFIQALYFRKYGFFASLSVRAGHYLFWHILQGIFVEQFELP